VPAPSQNFIWGTGAGPEGSPRILARTYLFTKSGFYGNSLAPFGPAPGDDRPSALGLHTGPEAVRLRSAAAVRLECTFRHEKSLALLSLADTLLKFSEIKV